MTPTPPALARRLGTTDAVLVGLGAMIGAGVYAAFGPAAAAAGSGLLIGLALAALIAFCNAVASAQLAAQYPRSGGTYVYGRERLGPWWGFLAGWGFVVGKTASCAAMALTFAVYAVPDSYLGQRLLAAAAVIGFGLLNVGGVSRTALANRVLVTTTLLVLTVLVVGIATGPDTSFDHVRHWSGPHGAYGVLQAAGLLFFAVAGYARIATLGEEVRDPTRTIPRAIPLALSITVVVYAAVAVAALAAAGPDRLASATAPLAEAVHAAGVPVLAPVVRVGGAIASLGALLALMAGVGRTTFAMARERDLPAWLDAVDQRRQVPDRAEIALTVIVTVLVLVAPGLRSAIGFSSFGVLVYYAVANAAAFTQGPSHRRWPRGLNVVGALGCVVLVAALPWPDVVAGMGVFAVGLLGRAIVLRRRSVR